MTYKEWKQDYEDHDKAERYDMYRDQLRTDYPEHYAHYLHGGTLDELIKTATTAICDAIEFYDDAKMDDCHIINHLTTCREILTELTHKRITTVSISRGKNGELLSNYTAPANTDTATAIANAVSMLNIPDTDDCFIEIDITDENGEYFDHDEGFGSIKNGIFTAEME